MPNYLILTGAAWLLTLSALAAEPAPKEVEIQGTLHTGVVAVGGETTGTVVKTAQGTVELDFGSDKRLRETGEKLDGKAVVVTGTLEVRRGVERKERKVLHVTRLKETTDR